MNFLSALALILLTLVGYSSGRVLARYTHKVMPGLLDVILVIFLWVGALYTRGGLGKGWAILIWLFFGGVIGLLVSLLMRDGQAVKRPALVSTRFFGRAWNSLRSSLSSSRSTCFSSFRTTIGRTTIRARWSPQRS